MASKELHQTIMLLTLSLLVLLTIASAQLDKFTNCSALFECGNITEIGYPFWSSPSRPSYCGHPDFQLTCSGQTASMTMSNLKYQVLNIDNSSRVLTLARNDYLTDICTQYLHNNSFDPNRFTYSQDTINLTMYYSCSTSDLSTYVSAGVLGQTNCTINGTESSGYYVINNSTSSSSGADTINEALDSCSDMVVAPANGSTVPTALTNVYQDAAEPAGILEQGFGLLWDADNTDASCSACKGSGGACGYGNDRFYCYCSSGAFPLRCNDSSTLLSPSGSPTSSTASGSGTTKLIIAGATAAGIILVGLVIGSWFLATRKRKKEHSEQSRKQNETIKMYITNYQTQMPQRYSYSDIKKILVGLVIGSWFLATRKRRKEHSEQSRKQNEAIKMYITNYQTQMPQRYSYSDIKKMTKKFAHKLGQGGFGRVYKGELPDGQAVAVKVLHASDNEAEEFLNEVASIGRTSHVNIVGLLGFCYDKKKALVYQYMPKGSLDKYTYKQGSQEMECTLEWNVLYDVAVGTARGLEYLHRGCNTRIVHLDIKPHNILLDEDFCPKIADFGLAKLYKGKESKVSMMGARGTPGYIAPEVFSRSFGMVSDKSDVYSYGMLVLEMVGARKNFDTGSSEASTKYFPDWIYEKLEQDEILVLQREINAEQEIPRKMILVGLWCIQTKPVDRPNMTRVIEMLEDNSRTLPMAPKPNLNLPARSPQYSSSGTSLAPYTSSGVNEDVESPLESSVGSQSP